MSKPATAAGFVASGALPIVVVIAVSCVVALFIAAWVVRDVARLAIQRSDEQDIPRVLAALGGWLEQLRLFLPWQGGELGSRRSIPPSDQPASDTDRTRDLSQGGTQ